MTTTPTHPDSLTTLQLKSIAMKRLGIFLLVMLAFSHAGIMAQGKDSLVLSLIDDSRWFDLRRLYRSESSEWNDYTRRYADAMIGNAFLQKGSYKKMKRLLKDKRTDDETQLWLSYLLASNLSRRGKNSKAASLLEKWLKQKQEVFGKEVLAGYAAYWQYYKTIGRNKSMHYVRPYGGVEIPFQVDTVRQHDMQSVVMLIEGEINGERVRFIFDTGAAMNVVSQELADRLNLTKTGVSMPVRGSKDLEEALVIAREMSVGNVVFGHVPFIVSNLPDMNSNIGYSHKINAIVGVPMMLALSRLDIDFKARRIRVGTEAGAPSEHIEPNLCFDSQTGGLRMEYEHEGKHYMCMPDFGAPWSMFGKHFFEGNKEKIIRLPTDTISYWGIGGIQNIRQHSLHDFILTIGGLRCKMPEVRIVEDRNFTDLLGMDVFQWFSKVIFDLDNMRLQVIP